MRLKRRFLPASLEAFRAGQIDAPRISHVDVLSHSKEWRPSSKIIKKGRLEGWLTLVDGKLTISTGPDDPDLVYDVLAPPGTYCLHCELACPDVAGETRPGKAARAHVAAEHKGKKSPAPNNWPAGYAVQHFYLCELAGESNG